MTSSDIAVAAGLTSFGDPGQVADLPDDLINKAVDKIHEILEDLIDQVKVRFFQPRVKIRSKLNQSNVPPEEGEVELVCLGMVM